MVGVVLQDKKRIYPDSYIPFKNVKSELPQSETSFGINVAAMLIAFVIISAIKWAQLPLSSLAVLAIFVAVMTISVWGLEYACRGKKSWFDKMTFKRKIGWKRVGFKLLGIACIFAIVAFGYWVLPVYDDGLFVTYLEVLKSGLGGILLLTVVYFALMDKIEDHPMVIPYGDRTGVIIEPLMTDQWFVDAPTLAKEAIRVVENGEMEFVPKSYEKTYFEWMRNIQPWCISRQLWWGHQMPIWYGPDGHIFCEENEEEAQAEADKFYGKREELTRETDVLDTWFSSGLWAFSTMGWPDKSEYLDTFYPTSVLVTGFDIIFFWLARMMMMSMYAMKRVPFKKAYIHGLVRDEKGQKMSKSKGNTVDPMETIEKYGADALRFFMAAMETQGRDVNLSEARIAGYRNFATKLWNAARFGEMNECNLVKDFDETKVTYAINKWVVAKAKQATKEVTDNLNAFRFSDAANAVYQFVWGSFCDWYIEMIKPILFGSDEAAKKETRATFAWVLDRILIILHPFMPFITTELWNNNYDMHGVKLIHAAWPKAETIDENALNDIDWAIDLISSIRSLRASMNLPAGAKLNVFLKDANAKSAENLQTFNHIICSLARLEKLETFAKDAEISKDMVQSVFKEAVILLPLKGIVDFAAERERLNKELASLNKNLEGYAKKLSNPSFVERAPAAVVEEEKRRQAEALENKAKVEEALARIANF